jgi:hypothetical protein
MGERRRSSSVIGVWGQTGNLLALGNSGSVFATRAFWRQLGHSTRDVEGSATFLERLLTEPRSAAAGIALTARMRSAGVVLPRDDDVNVRAARRE